MASKVSPKPGSSATVFSSCYLSRNFDHSVSERSIALRRLAGRFTILSDTARTLGDFELENTLISTVAEIVTSADQITTANYGPALIDRLSIAAAQTEQRLDQKRWLSMQHAWKPDTLLGTPTAVAPQALVRAPVREHPAQ